MHTSPQTDDILPEDDDRAFHDGDEDEEDPLAMGHANIAVRVEGVAVSVSADDATTCADLLELALDAVSKLRNQVQ